MNNEVSELLRPFVNGNFDIIYRGDSTVTVTGQSQYALAFNEPLRVAVHGVPVVCKTSTASVRAMASYTMILNDRGVPQSMTVDFSDLDAQNEQQATALLPVGESVKATMTPTNATHPFEVGTDGTTNFTGGNNPRNGIPYNIVRTGMAPS